MFHGETGCIRLIVSRAVLLICGIGNAKDFEVLLAVSVLEVVADVFIPRNYTKHLFARRKISLDMKA